MSSKPSLRSSLLSGRTFCLILACLALFCCWQTPCLADAVQGSTAQAEQASGEGGVAEKAAPEGVIPEGATPKEQPGDSATIRTQPEEAAGKGQETTPAPAPIMPVEGRLAIMTPGNTTLLLQEAIRTRNASEIDAALNAGAQITDESLWLAAIYADPQTLRFLLKRADLSPSSKFSIRQEPGPRQDKTPVGLSLRRKLLSYLNPEMTTESLDNVTLLQMAALAGNTEVARYLVEEGVDLNETTSEGNTAIGIAYAAWLRSWNPMHVAPDAFTSLRKDSNYPGFIYFLLDSGADTTILDERTEAKRDQIERYVVSLTTSFMVPMKDGTYRSVGSLLEEACTRTAWGLVNFHVFAQDKPNYCLMIVVFFGRLKSDDSSIRVPFAFLDDRFIFPGDRSTAGRYLISSNDRYLSQQETLTFWETMGVDLHHQDFWKKIDADFALAKEQ